MDDVEVQSPFGSLAEPPVKSVEDGRALSQRPLFLQGIRVPEDWFLLPGVLLPLGLAAHVSRTGCPMPIRWLASDERALLECSVTHMSSWLDEVAIAAALFAVQHDAPRIELDPLLAVLRVAAAGQNVGVIDADELRARLELSLSAPEYIWDRHCASARFTPWERAGCIWTSSNPVRL